MCCAAEGAQKPIGAKLVRDGCRSIWCAECGLGVGWKLRKRLEERYRVKRVRRAGMVTLTCSPAILGSDLQQQFEQVKAQRLVSRFVREFRRVVGKPIDYFSVMEFHHRSKQIHFHMALDDLGRLSKRKLIAMQDWCQEHMGTFDYKYMSREEAVGYCLKYLTKGSQDQLPEWCLDYKGRIRPFTASRGFWHDSKPRKQCEPTGKKRNERTLRYRIQRCKTAGVVGIKEAATEQGELVHRFGFTSSIPFEDWKLAALQVIPSDRLEEVARSRYSIWLEIDELTEVATLLGITEAAGVRRRTAAGTAA
ncbi:MAG: hypothetical protein DHS20C16_02810 [Phycisphaerae bacterium]|nr:MAG: hypothetical protein DHS20C16_02810 [Phycisphaerae bacterium]